MTLSRMWRITAVCRLMRMLYYMYVRYSSRKLDNIHHPAICVCIFLHFFHSIYVRNSAISSSNSTKTSIFLVHYCPSSLISNQIICHHSISFVIKYTTESTLHCQHLLNMQAPVGYRESLGGLEPVRKREIFWMNNSVIYSKYLDIIFFHWQ